MGSRAGGFTQSYQSTAGSMASGAGAALGPHPPPNSSRTSSGSPSEQDYRGWDSEDGSIDPDLREYQSETPRRPGGFRRTPLSEDEAALVYTHMGMELMNPTPRAALSRSGAQQPISPSQRSSNHPGLAPVGGRGRFHQCPPFEIRPVIRRCADEVGMTLSSLREIEDVLRYWGYTKGSVMARNFLDSGSTSWFSFKGMNGGPCSCGRVPPPDWLDPADFMGSYPDVGRPI